MRTINDSHIFTIGIPLKKKFFPQVTVKGLKLRIVEEKKKYSKCVYMWKESRKKSRQSLAWHGWQFTLCYHVKMCKR